MEDGEGAVGILVPNDLGPGVVVAMTVGWDLQAQTLVTHPVVVADDTIALDTEDLGQSADEGYEVGAGFLGRPVEPRVVGGAGDGEIVRLILGYLADMEPSALV